MGRREPDLFLIIGKPISCQRQRQRQQQMSGAYMLLDNCNSPVLTPAAPRPKAVKMVDEGAWDDLKKAMVGITNESASRCQSVRNGMKRSGPWTVGGHAGEK